MVHVPLGTSRHAAADSSAVVTGHFILQAQQEHFDGLYPSNSGLGFARSFPAYPATQKAPVFTLAGLAIGNGLTDPITQARSPQMDW